jgi:hypothetical protein
LGGGWLSRSAEWEGPYDRCRVEGGRGVGGGADLGGPGGGCRGHGGSGLSGGWGWTMKGGVVKGRGGGSLTSPMCRGVSGAASALGGVGGGWVACTSWSWAEMGTGFGRHVLAIRRPAQVGFLMWILTAGVGARLRRIAGPLIHGI